MAVSENTGACETDFVKEHWTHVWNQSDFGKGAREQVERRTEFEIMAPILKSLPQGARILDGGCGLGAWTLGLSSMGYKVTGMDLSEKTILKLKEMFPGEQFEAGDLRATRFSDDEFDAYFSWGVFEHFEAGLGACLNEAHRIVKKNGHLFISVPFHNRRLWRRDHMPLGAVEPDYIQGRGYAKSMRFYQWRLTEQELRRELEMHGFTVQSVMPIHKEVGVHRMLVTDYGISANSMLHNVLLKLLSPVLPSSYIANMVMAVGVKKLKPGSMTGGQEGL